MKRERFKRVATKRVNNVLKYMRLLNNCLDKNNYHYNSDELIQIIKVIDSEWKQTKNNFKSRSISGKEDEFNL